MNKEKFVWAIFFIISVAFTLTFFVLGSIYGFEGEEVTKKCYDRYSNEIIGMTCKGTEMNDYFVLTSIGGFFMVLFLFLNWLVNFTDFEQVTNFFGFEKGGKKK